SSREQVRQLASELRPRRIIHLASRGTVITPLSLLPAMLDTCVDGLVNLLEEIAPDQIVFASTCSVYRNAPQEGASPVWDDVHPVSIYGLTKAVGELAIHQWVEASGGSGVILRMGNIVGTGGKGLIP